MNNNKPRVVRFSIALAATCLATAFATPALAQEKAKPASPPAKMADKPAETAGDKDQRDTKVLVENDKVRVTETRYKVGASSGMSERGNRVVRAMSDGTVEKTFPDGKKETITWKKDQVRFNPKEKYAQKNIGKTDLVLYVVNLK